MRSGAVPRLDVIVIDSAVFWSDRGAPSLALAEWALSAVARAGDVIFHVSAASQTGPRFQVTDDDALGLMEEGFRVTVTTAGGCQIATSPVDGGVVRTRLTWPIDFTPEPRAVLDGVTSTLKGSRVASGVVARSDRPAPFRALGYNVHAEDVPLIPGYGWLIVIDQSLVSELAIGPEIAWVQRTCAGPHSVLLAADAPDPDQRTLDGLDALVESVRVERRGSSKGGQGEEFASNLSRADQALAYPGPLEERPSGHPDPFPFTTEARKMRDRDYPDRHHRIPK